MKYIVCIILLSITHSLNAQLVASHKDQNSIYGKFGGTIGLVGASFERYVNIGSNSITASQSNLLFGVKPDLTLNGSGGTVNFGGEVTRSSSNEADLLPYAYGRTNGAGIFVGTNNFSVIENPQNGYTEIILDDPDIQFNNLTIIVTPKRIQQGDFLVGSGTQAQVSAVQPGVTDDNSHKFRVYLFNSNGNAASGFFSFIVYKT